MCKMGCGRMHVSSEFNILRSLQTDSDLRGTYLWFKPLQQIVLLFTRMFAQLRSWREI
jgi:hypothetical protein